MNERACIIVGAGPAGLSAAIAAARRGRSVVVLEKNARPGRKLLLAGGGRANLLDPASPALDALEAYGRSGRFLRQVLSAFSLADFLKELRVETEREKAGLRSGSTYVRGGARRLLDALLAEARRLRVEVVCGASVRAAARLPDGGFEVRSARLDWKCSRLIVATGGMTYPSTGSSGDGYRLAEFFGHEIEPPRPALCPLATDPSFPNLAGVSVPGASLTLRRAGRKVSTRRGALLFAHHGLSGPAALDLSLELARASSSLEDVPGAQLMVDLSPDMTREQIIEEFLAISRAGPNRRLENAGLTGTLPARLVAELAKRAGIDPARRIGRISRLELAALAAIVKALAMTIREPLDPHEAMVTVGGVLTNALNPHTMESRLVPGLRFAGEVLAPAGPCGGYNLLMAFATGRAAGS
ncbi:MAG: aminoacetone oxidase family FAD-binding enzyme [Planctomycetota bacterium]